MSLEIDNKKDMECNILFSDLFGTLISEYSDLERGSHEEYNKRFKEVAPFLNEFVSENNFWVIATSAHHTGVFACLQLIREYNEYISEENRKKIFWFISDKNYKHEMKRWEYIDNLHFSDLDIDVGLVQNKVECIDIVLKKLKDYNIKSIGAIGDDINEVDMLRKIYEYGGLTGIIGGGYNIKGLMHSFMEKYSNQSRVDSLINSIADIRYDMEMSCFITSHNNVSVPKNIEELIKFGQNPMISIIKKNRDKRAFELKQMLETCNITEKDLERILYLNAVAYRYMVVNVPLSKIYENYHNDLINQVDEIGSNFSFDTIGDQKQLLKGSGEIKKIFYDK